MMSREQYQQLANNFEVAAPYLQATLDRTADGKMTLDDVRDRVMLGDLQLWLGEGFAGTTEVLDYPQRRVVLVHLAGGKLDAMLPVYPQIEEFAKSVGATGIEIAGREGWARVMKDRGFKVSAVHLFKEV